jgi:hypothetical protein
MLRFLREVAYLRRRVLLVLCRYQMVAVRAHRRISDLFPVLQPVQGMSFEAQRKRGAGLTCLELKTKLHGAW